MQKPVTQFGFILGRDYELSVAEIIAVYKKSGHDFNLIRQNKSYLIVEAEWRPEIATLGGSIKIFEILGKVTAINEILDHKEWLKTDNKDLRINFGISNYGASRDSIRQLGFDIKEQLEKSEDKVRFVVGKSAALSSVIVNENKLIARGFELVIIKSGSEYTVGRTLEVQDYKAYSKRDFGRPARDDKSGMLPPKLAQIMINLGEQPTSTVVYDPFCGSGTILQEAALLGYKNILGSDISEKAVSDSIQNIKWLNPGISPEIFVSDITNPSKKISADLIVGEGFLGEPNRRNKDQAINDAKKLVEFYVQALLNINKTLTSTGRAVIAIPFFIVGKEYVYLPILEKISKTGLRIIKPEIGIHLPGRGNLTYHRPDSFVGREIIILEHK